MDSKSAVVKSKSSNGGVANKQEKQKITRSDVEFHPLNIKKRGVYVENKDNRKLLNVYENNDAEAKKKPPPRPRPGQKKFLTSVLTILSKSTTGTQYPDSDDEAKVRRKKNSNKILERNRKHENKIKDKEYVTETRTKGKRSKYKSKILNGDNYIPFNDKLVTLQSKKDIIHTPSNFSESFTICDSANPIKDLLENNIYSGVAEGLAKQILEGRLEKSISHHVDSTTLVTDPPKDDKKIYNFFVDLIETTFDVYNIETEQTTNKESDTIIEIDETVAKKLNFINDTTLNKESDLSYNIQEETITPDTAYENTLKLSKKKVSKSNSLKAQSFIYPKPKYVQKTNSVVIKSKPQTKKAKKKDLLNTIKEELKMDFMSFEEPQNLYQALRNMAKYKRKCQQKKTIRFESEDNPNINRECLFSRGIFPMKKLGKFKNHDKGKDLTQLNTAMNLVKSKKTPLKVYESHHSLKVYGIEYEKDNDDNERKYATSSNFAEEDDYDPVASLGFSDSSIDIKGFYSVIQD